MNKKIHNQKATDNDCYTLLSAVFDLEEVIDIVERLIHATEDDVYQYGGEPSEDEDVIDGKKLLTALINCR